MGLADYQRRCEEDHEEYEKKREAEAKVYREKEKAKRQAFESQTPYRIIYRDILAYGSFLRETVGVVHPESQNIFRGHGYLGVGKIICTHDTPVPASERARDRKELESEINRLKKKITEIPR